MNPNLNQRFHLKYPPLVSVEKMELDREVENLGRLQNISHVLNKSDLENSIFGSYWELDMSVYISRFLKLFATNDTPNILENQ